MSQDDSTLFQTLRTELFTAVVGDIMDQLGYYKPVPATANPAAAR